MKEIVKKVPLRKCVVTNNQLPKSEMFRVVRTPEGDIVIDETGKTRGHGVYLSKDKKVVELAKKKHLLNKYLEMDVSDEIYDKLLERLKN